jgi:predicted kinase
MVRAKVATLGNQANDQTFKKYLYLTQSYQEQSPPAIYLMHGLSGTGKSYLSHKMIKAINAIRIRSEIERDRIYKELQRKGKKLELHSPEVNSRLSHHLIKLTEQLLSMGYKVIVDGTFLKQHFRQKYLRLAAKHNVPIKIISCQCNYNLMQARLKKAIRTESITRDRSLQRLALQASDQQLLSQDEIPFQHKVDTDDDQAINRFLIELKSQ